ncbi:B-cell receptor CD22-like [Pygocentrus nattereri]|uniref:B-cell receptor CD22-like n=1 Tax=Pygocentrus nattereri TaxID=42514 RepID=UPI001890D461|nr:B-cell receptor CD22-like [Pygocentrus nattereri]
MVCKLVIGTCVAALMANTLSKLPSMARSQVVGTCVAILMANTLSMLVSMLPASTVGSLVVDTHVTGVISMLLFRSETRVVSLMKIVLCLMSLMSWRGWQYIEASMMTSTRMVPPLPVTFLLLIVSKSTYSTVTSLQQLTRKTSLSISPSGEIVEGSSVNLTCSCDASSPVEKYIWYKTVGHYEGLKMKSIGNGTSQTYEIRDINTGHSGGYRCLPYPGGPESDMVLLNVFYAPRIVSVSISPSGEIVEGSSVTLTCSSDGNPPVEIYTWFKKTEVASGKGGKYSITKISSEDRGEYTCKATNKYGTSHSPAVYLNVLYPPKRVSVSISPSGEIVEGSSVTLTCSSDGNPPEKNYTWFKEGGTSPVAFGQSYSIINISRDGKGGFYCEVQNSIGSQKSPVVSVLESGHPINVKYAVIGLTACGGFLLFVLLWIRCKQNDGHYKDINSHNPSTATAVDASLDPVNQDNILYTSVSSRAPLSAQASVSCTGDRVEYTSVKLCHNTDGTKISGDDIIYASVQFHQSDLCSQLEEETAEDLSVIYSSVKQHKYIT